MKKVFVLAMLISTVCYSVNAQVTDTGDKVGIGTTSPTEKLEVVGNLKASGTITATKFHHPNGNAYFLDVYTTSYLNYLNAENFYLRDDGINEGINWNNYGQGISVPSIGQGGYKAFRFNSDIDHPFYFEGACN